MNQKKIEITYVDPSELEPNVYNPNRHDAKSFDMLLRSLEMFGFTIPILAQKNTNIIIDGEHRWRASMVLKKDKVPVHFVEYTEQEMKIATVMHNMARGGEDLELRSLIESDLKDMGLNPDEAYWFKLRAYLYRNYGVKADQRKSIHHYSFQHE